MEWCLYGNDVRENFEKGLEPGALEEELMRYQYVFEDEFSLQDLLTILDLRAKALIAEAINNAPEFLIDQIGKARNSYDFPSLVRAMERIVNVMEETV